MQQRQKRLRPAEGAGEVDLSNEEEGHEERQRFLQIAGINRKHWTSFRVDGDGTGASKKSLREI
jgi:hypothetical protein